MLLLEHQSVAVDEAIGRSLNGIHKYLEVGVAHVVCCRQHVSKTLVGCGLKVGEQLVVLHWIESAATQRKAQSYEVYILSFLSRIVHRVVPCVTAPDGSNASPVITTTMQVSSRLFLVWGITQQFPEVRRSVSVGRIPG